MMKSRPEISVIIPVYRVEAFIRRTINSVISQDTADWELILVDDGSPDSSGQICDELASTDNRISVIHQANEGVSAARNKGLSKATGQYICFIDGDDYVNSDYLSSMLSHINGNDAVYGNVTHDYPTEGRSATAFEYTDGATIILSSEPEKLVQYRIPENGFPVAKLFRRNIIEKYNLKFDTRLSYHEDQLFVLSYLEHCSSIALCATPSYHYLHLPAGGSLSKRPHPARSLIIASNHLLEAVRRIISERGITDSDYIDRMYTILGLNQILLGLKNKNLSEIPAIANAARRHRQAFLKHYRPNHLSRRFIPFLFFLYLDKLLIPFIKCHVKDS